ncbi:hypothetical protein V8G56_05920 [Gaetbulibacter aquiaggeris]|uniref:Anti-sigma factor n=1 Tax=Gaetbulibacter aquiaggeris TaxID=1735373 RepID=A0ABW7MN72_9FLAO
MAQDIRELFKEDKTQERMPENHQERFLSKLEETLPVKKKTKFFWFQMAASVVVLIGLSFGTFNYFQPEQPINNVIANKVMETKTLGDVSPGLKKVEDYYLASINLELSKVKYTDENKDVFDGYIEQLNILNKEYKNLSVELTENGPSELTVNALIDNLKYRLNLLYRLREQLNELNASDAKDKEASQSI